MPDSRVEIVSNGDVLLTKVGSKTLDNLFLAGLDVIRISLYDGPHQIQEFLNLKAKHSLSDDQFMIRKSVLRIQREF